MPALQITAGILAVCSTLWLGYASYKIWSFGHSDHAAPADCAIVLGAAVLQDEPSPVFAERIRHAIALFQAGVVSKIVFTGGLARGDRLAEAEAGKRFALRAGLPASALLTETRSTTTYENLREARGLMRRHGLATAVIVSDPLHLKRAAMMAHDLGLQAVTSPTPNSTFRAAPAKMKFLLRELFFCHYYVLARQLALIHPHPKRPAAQ